MSRASLRVASNGHADAVRSPSQVRCALYVRKSTEVDEEHGFNSLDAQRLACEDYVRARVGENWHVLPEQYTDGGWSGATVNRPAFQRLLADIEFHKIDCVVVHRVDRLSRSLLDFAQLMRFFQEHGVSFVSVTQNFSTADPVGRLTLNLLATFSEFEREMIVARTRDKVAAARRKGRWTGGMPILGYDLDPRGGRLLLNEPEASQVREIFRLYLGMASLTRVVEELNRRGLRRKTWTKQDGSVRNGGGFDKPSLLRLLKNPLYAGKVHHRGTLHAGEHEVIVPDETWQRAQALLTRNGSAGYQGGERVESGALLKGLLYCAQCGCRMTPSYTTRGNRRHRYYVCQARLKKGAHACPTGRVAAHEIERRVVDQIRAIGRDPELIAETASQAKAQREELVTRLEAEGKALRREFQGKRASLKRLVAKGGKPAEIQAVQSCIAAMQARLSAIPGKIHATKRVTFTEQEVRSALEAFGPVWEALWPGERARIIGLIVTSVVYAGPEGSLEVVLRTRSKIRAALG